MRSKETSIALRGPVPMVHLLLRLFIKPGDHVVDATCGNGKDTLLLAGLVGEHGRVTAFDIQAPALERTAGRLAESGLTGPVRMHSIGHERISEHVSTPVAAVVFNLGWLPGAEKDIVTTPDTTLPALNSSLELLKPGGVLTVTCYPGHEAGRAETAAVTDWASSLDPSLFHSWRLGQMNTPADAPFCLLVQKAYI